MKVEKNKPHSLEAVLFLQYIVCICFTFILHFELKSDKDSSLGVVREVPWTRGANGIKILKSFQFSVRIQEVKTDIMNYLCTFFTF